MRRFKPLCLSAVLALFAAPLFAAPKTQADAIQEANALLEAGKFSKAAAAFQQADKLSGGGCGSCMLGLARAHSGDRQYDKAVTAARRAIETLDTPAAVGLAWNQLGMALAMRKNPDHAGAEEALRKAIGFGGPLLHVYQFNLADVLWRRKQFAESETLARAALLGDPEGPLATKARIVLCQAKADGTSAPPLEEVYVKDEGSCGLMAPLPGGEQPQRVEGAVQRPVKLFGRPPSYPEEARKEHVEGIVLLESVIDTDGCIKNLRICRGLRPALDKAAHEEVRHWVFKPATLLGEPVMVYYTLTVSYTMGSRPGPG